jgi:acyl carrier protein
MDRGNLKERFIETITKVLKKRGLEREIKFEQPLDELGLGLDSMGRLELLIEIEKEFQLEFEEEDWGTNMFKTPNEILGYIRERYMIV